MAGQRKRKREDNNNFFELQLHAKVFLTTASYVFTEKIYFCSQNRVLHCQVTKQSNIINIS